MVSAASVAALVVALFAAWLGLGIGGDTVVAYVDDLGTVAAALAATILCVRAGSRNGRKLRRFWWLLAGAAGAWALAEGIWAVYELVLHDAVPVPSWADVGYLAGIPLAVAALLSHPAIRGSGGRKARAVLDGLVIATALLFLSWTLVLGPLWRSTDLTTLGGMVTLAYPLGDVVIVFFIVLAICGLTAGDRLALWCLLGGLLIMALSDTTYAYLTGVKSYETGSLIDAGWLAAYLAIALGAICATSRHAVTPDRGSPSLTMPALVAPFVPLFLALGVAAVGIELGHRLDEVAWIAAVVLVALVLIRQTLLVVELLAPDHDPQADMLERLGQAALGLRAGETATEDSSALASPGLRHE